MSRPADDVTQIHGNIYLGRVQNVLPGMEAAFVDIGTPKNAVLYRGDVQYDAEDIEEKGNNPRIEQILKPKQTIVCQVTKNPIAHKGARLTQEVSLPGRFVVLIPNSTTYGISKRLPDDERKRLRGILDKVKPEGPRPHRAHRGRGRHAPRRSSATSPACSQQWEQIEALAKKTQAPGPALPRARHGRPGHPRGVQRGLPRRRHRRPRALRGGPRLRRQHLARAGRPGAATTTPRSSRCRSSSATTCTSSSTRPSTARCGCRRAARSSSSTPRRSPSST